MKLTLLLVLLLATPIILMGNIYLEPLQVYKHWLKWPLLLQIKDLSFMTEPIF